MNEVSLSGNLTTSPRSRNHVSRGSGSNGPRRRVSFVVFHCLAFADQLKDHCEWDVAPG